LRLSRTSGLHPTCFPLTGLQKLGEQVAAGGFGDIWKGLFHGQNISVKVMRLFEESDVKTVLKVRSLHVFIYSWFCFTCLQEFGREAVIWRQLCHPNLLPFLGLHYLDKRLCLVSPWMENGNIMKFLSKETQKIDRLSLVSVLYSPPIEPVGHLTPCAVDIGRSLWAGISPPKPCGAWRLEGSTCSMSPRI